MRTLSLFAIGIIFGGGIGFVTAAGTGVTLNGHDHGEHAQQDSAQHDHTTAADQDHSEHHGDASGHATHHDTPIEVDAGAAPMLNIALSKDPMSGYNLHVMVKNFTFAPEQASRANVPGHGHAHVYVNGVKQGRLYGPWVHLASLPKGDVTVEVSLNANSHQPLALDGVPIQASTTVKVE